MTWLMEIKKACYFSEQQACSLILIFLKACKLAVHLLGKQGQHHRVLPKKDRLPNMGFLLNPLKTKSFINEKGPGETEPSFYMPALHRSCVHPLFRKGATNQLLEM
jgi:hypothetical protein